MTDPYSRVVFDTNVLISAFLAPLSVPAQALKQLQRNGVVLASDESLAELEEVLFRRKFDSRLSITTREFAFMAYLTLVERIDSIQMIRACRDPKDDKFLSLAVSGDADLILTGDTDLLALHPFRGIDILTPKDYLAR